MQNRHYLEGNETLLQRACYRRALLLGIILSVMATPNRAAAQTAPTALPKDIVLVLDNSGSMKKNDPQFLTKEVVAQFIKGWPDEARGSVVIFDKHILAIPWESRDSVNLTQLNYRGLLTNIPAAVQRAIQELKLNGRPGAARSIVLLTDGVIDTGTKAQDREVTHWLRAQLASDAASTGVKIFTVALGTGSDNQLLQELAQRTGGRYFWALQAKDLPGIFAQVSDAFFASAAPAVSAKAGSEKASIPPSNAPTRESDQRVNRSAPVSLVVPSQSLPTTPVELEVRVMYGVLVITALFMTAILALIALLLYYREPKRGAKSVVHAPLAFSIPLPEAFLFDRSGVTGPERHELGAVTVVGRVPTTERNHIAINRPTISGAHAVIVRKHDGFWLIDQDSKNGTYVNGDPVTNPKSLTHGDRVQFHDFVFEFALANETVGDMTILKKSGPPANWAVAEETGLDKRDWFSDSRPRNQTTNPATIAYVAQDRASPREDGETKPDPDDTEYEHHQRSGALFGMDDTFPNARTLRTSLNDYFKP